jgi:hypothetical protein
MSDKDNRHRAMGANGLQIVKQQSGAVLGASRVSGEVTYARGSLFLSSRVAARTQSAGERLPVYTNFRGDQGEFLGHLSAIRVDPWRSVFLVAFCCSEGTLIWLDLSRVVFGLGMDYMALLPRSRGEVLGGMVGDGGSD